MKSINMITKLLVTVALPLCIAWNNVPAYAQMGLGVVRGVTLRPDGAPLAEAQVLIHNQTDNSDQSVVSGPDGAFVAVDLKPGRYTLIASKEGFLTSSAAVQLKAHENLSVALALSARAIVSSTAPSQPVAVSEERASLAPADPQAKALEAMQERIERLEAMQKRIEQLEAELRQMKAQAAAPWLPRSRRQLLKPLPRQSPPAANARVELPLYASLGDSVLGFSLNAARAAGSSGCGKPWTGQCTGARHHNARPGSPHRRIRRPPRRLRCPGCRSGGG